MRGSGGVNDLAGRKEDSHVHGGNDKLQVTAAAAAAAWIAALAG